MRTYILYLLLCQGIQALSQGGAPFVVSDAGSLAGSTAITGLYSGMGPVEQSRRTAANGFIFKYTKRLPYLEGALPVVVEINNEILEIKTRYNDLERRNNSLTLFSYSTKKNNTRSLKTIRTMLDNITQELLRQDAFNILVGEKVNLYVNTMKSLWEIHEFLDEVESRIDNTSLFRRLFG